MPEKLASRITRWIARFLKKHTPSPPSVVETKLPLPPQQSKEWDIEQNTPTSWQTMRLHDLEHRENMPAPPPSPPTTLGPGLSSQDPTHRPLLEALKRLQKLPYGINVEGRSAAVLSLLSDTGVLFAAIRAFRWPENITCPRCHSSRVQRRPAPQHTLSQDQWFYTCLNCQGLGTPADFEDTTNLPIEDLQTFKQWMTCYYLLGFCSPAQLAKILGLSADVFARLMFIAEDITIKQKQELSLKKENVEEAARKKKQKKPPTSQKT